MKLNWGFSVLKFFWDNFLKSALVLPLQENLQPSSSHSIMAASALYFLSLLFTQFVNIKTQFCSSNLFFKKIQNFQCISSCGTEWNFLFNKRGKNVLGTRILCCPCFFFNTKITCIQVCPFPGRKRRDPEFCPFDGQAWWKEFAAAAWEICYGKSASQLCPSNHQISLCLVIWWGNFQHQASFLPILGLCCEHFPYPPPLISEGWSKCSIPFV